MRKFQLDRILFLLDFLKVVSTIEGCQDWSLKSSVMDILELSKSFASLKFKHISGALNMLAHSLVKFGINSKEDA